MERLSAWLNPLGESLEEGEVGLDQWKKATFEDVRAEKRWIKENVKLAWEICPNLAIYMPARFILFFLDCYFLAGSVSFYKL